MQKTQETQVSSLDREEILEKEMATHCGTLAWKIPWAEESGRLQSMGQHRARHYCVTKHTAHTYIGSLVIEMRFRKKSIVQRPELRIPGFQLGYI